MLADVFKAPRLSVLILLPRFLLVLTLGVATGFRAGGQTVNRTLPPHAAPQVGLVLPENATEAEIKSARIFEEPLVPVGRSPSAHENRRLAVALRQHTSRSDPDDFSVLERYLEEQPDSVWAPSVAFNLAGEYYNTGWYSKSLRMWERAWPLLKPASDLHAKALADRAAGELAFMYGRLGRMTELSALLDSLEGRAFIGSATEKIAGAREGLWTMQHRPEIAFRCGPYALERILNFTDPAKAGSPLIRDSKSTTNGCSLAQVADLSRQLGMNYQMAFRSNGAALLRPAVVNWKAGHYAAMLKEENGRYLFQDPTFGNDAWISKRALEAEASGYFLVSAGELPAGWRRVDAAEGSLVFGKGATTAKDDTSTTDCDPKTCGGSGTGMPVASTHLMLVSLNIQDRPVGYTPPVGPPVFLRLTYNQRDAGQPAGFSYSNLGPKWTFNWLAYIADNPSSLAADVSYYTDGGGTLSFTGFDNVSQTYAPPVKSQAMLRRTSATSYELTTRNGSKLIFAQPGSFGGTFRRVFLTQIVDPAGNFVQITYDNNFRVVGITDAIGQVTTLSYQNPSDNLKITKVTDPFGRFATFTYDASNRLAQITDTIGITSQFTYDSGDFIQSLTTPYGTNSFEKGENGPQRWLVTTYPNGEKDRVEFYESGYIGIPDSDPAATVPAGMSVANIYNTSRNSFFWNRKAYAEAAGDYTKAHLYHWLHFSGGVCSGILESEKAPLENRVWYSYDGQPSTITYGTTDQPNAVGRVLDDGTTQLTTLHYNSMGIITNLVDPMGRSLTYVYATNQTDLLEVRQTTGANNDLLTQISYNAQHLPVAIRNAAGQMTTNIYNARGQLVATTSPNGETTALSYDPNGYLLAIDGPLPGMSDRLTLSYDSVGRVRTVIGPDGYAITNSYDNLDRLTNRAYPDGTFEAFTYDRLDWVKRQDRLGRVTQYSYDTLRRLISVQDPLNRTVNLQYCGCGALSALVDALGRPTRWDYDIQGRVTSKQFADGSKVLFSYENATSRLKSVRDEKGQVKSFTYYADNNLMRVAYPVAQVATPAITYSYDPNYNRLSSMQDGIGTTTYTYYPAGSLGALQVASVSGPWINDTVTYSYDSLGRTTNRTIAGIAQTYAYDPLGRITNIVNALGSFSYLYDGATARLLDALYPNGRATHYDFFNNLGDRRLQGITHRRADSSVISRFAYLYNTAGTITNWLQELGGVTNNWSLGYDAADQLTAAQLNQGATNVNYTESYDPAGNRLAETISSVGRTFQCNALNQLVSSSDTTVTNASYEWDAEQRLAAVNQGTNRSEFYYDGAGRRVRIVEKQNGAIVAERRFVWCGMELCEERDSTGGLVQKRFFVAGVQLLSGPAPGSYFYTRDHLGSLREMHDATGLVRARYDYGLYGQQAKLGGDLDSDWGFTGYFSHPQTALYLAPLRAYDPRTARWLSRDPIGELGGLNLYGYAGNDPVNLYDPLGLCFLSRLRNAGVGLYAGAAGGAVGGAAVGGTLGFLAGGVNAVPGAVAGAAGGAVVGGTWGAISGFLSPCSSPGDVALEQFISGVLSGGLEFLPGLSELGVKIKGINAEAGSWLAVSRQTFTKFERDIYSIWDSDLKLATVFKTAAGRYIEEELPAKLAEGSEEFGQGIVDWLAADPSDQNSSTTPRRP